MSKMFLSIVSKYRQRNDVDQYPRMNDTLFLIGFKKTQENVDKNYFLTCNRFWNHSKTCTNSESFSQIAIEWFSFWPHLTPGKPLKRLEY